MPAAAQTPCDLYLLPANATNADLENGFALRGAQVVTCEARRQLAVGVHEGEHADEARWLQDACERRRGWRVWRRCEPEPPS